MAYKFFNIGKANEEIDKLEAAVAKLTAERDAIKDNDSTVAAEAEKLKTGLAAADAKVIQLESDLSTARASIASVTAEKEKIAAELKEANDRLANPSEEIKRLASQKALELSAAQGVPITQLPATKDEKTETLDSIRNQMQTETDPVKKSNLAKRARVLRGHEGLF